MFIARFSYDVLPADRPKALEFVRHEVQAARADGLDARMLIPLTRGHGGPALVFEVTLTSLDQLQGVRHRGGGSAEATEDWMRGFSEILRSPPEVEILRVEAS
jgi:hypothetical protein